MTPPEPHSPIKITGVCGSLSANGATKRALKIALDGAAELGAEVSLLKLRDLDLVIFGSVNDPTLQERLLNVGRQAMKFTSLQQKVQQDDFKAMWKTLPTW